MSKSMQKGTDFETLVVNGLQEALGDDRIERRAKNGVKDRGDIAGLRLHGQKVVAECKNIVNGKTLHLPQWTEEARIEAGNDDALVGVVIHKRTGSRKPLEQWVSMTLADFVAILTGEKRDQ